MHPLVAIAVVAIGSLLGSFSSTSAWSQNFGNINSGFLIGNPTAQVAPARPMPPIFTANTGGVVTSDGANAIFQSSPGIPSANQIYQWATGPSAGLTTWDNIRSVIQVNPGTTVSGMNGYGSYVDNELTSLSGSSRNGVNYFGTCVTGVNNAWCWGNNIVLSDSKTQTAGSLTGVNLIGVEINPNVWSTNTVVNGVQLVGDSGVQPQVANGFVCNLLDISGAARAKWSGCLVSAAGAANTAAIIGQQSASGNNINSQTISFGVFDNTGAAKSYQFQGTSGASISSYNFTHTIDGTVFWSFDDKLLTPANTGYYVNFDNLIGADASHNATVAGGAGIATVEIGNTTAPVTIAAPSLIFAAPSAGTPVASICIDAANHIFKKTTAGSCI